ncbi:MAG: amidohydrolase family protein [Clostridiales Family XIII bacterium]|jgi:predicted amidohydrolase YtcJ|nr:amidohydrolase family protein [Clostridiales Family XIII bacterium]
MSGEKADLILTGGRVYAGRGLPGGLTYVAIHGDRILDVGDGDIPSDIMGGSTVVRVFGPDTLIMPGIHDHHVHLVLAGMLDKYVNLYTASSAEECALKAKKGAADLAGEEWVIGFGFCRQAWENTDSPHRALLDEYVNDRPVLLLDSELHAAWANTRALELAGIDAATPDPPFGEIMRDVEGVPTGYLIESALSFAARKAFDFSEDIATDLIKRYAKAANRFGITSVSDMTPYLGIDLSFHDAYMSLAKAGELDVRVNAALDLFSDPAALLPKAAEAAAVPGGMYSIRYMKQFVDGILANYTAMMLEEYSTGLGGKGGSLLPLDKLGDAVIAANEQGIPVRLHACGDGAVRVALDAFEVARRVLAADGSEGYTDGFPRNEVEHIEVIAPADIHRFRELGVIASVQPEHITSGLTSHRENCYPEYLGPERERYTWPFRSFLDAGVILAMGSDAPVVEGSPFEGMYVGLTRVFDDGTPEGGWVPEEKLSMEELIEGYTYSAAFAEGLEDELGTLAPGKLADISVIDRDLLAASLDEVRAARALMTVVGGRIVYEGKIE